MRRSLFDGATLPFALFEDRYFRSVPVGCSRFSRCCHLIIDLGPISRDGSWARRLMLAPELGESFECNIPATAGKSMVCFAYCRSHSTEQAVCWKGTSTPDESSKCRASRVNRRLNAISTEKLPFIFPAQGSGQAPSLGLPIASGLCELCLPFCASVTELCILRDGIGSSAAAS